MKNVRRNAKWTWLVVLAACGGGAPATGPTVPTSVELGGARRAIRMVTDLDDTRDVAVSASRVCVATDRGVVAYPTQGDPVARRWTTAEGLPSDDVTAIGVTADGACLAATSTGLARLSGDAFVAEAGAPNVGRVVDVLIEGSGVEWLCGTGGVARKKDGAWSRFGEPAQCTTLAPTPDGKLWVGLATGVWYVEGDVLREHGPTSGIPEPYVFQLAPLAGGKTLAIVLGPSDSRLAYFDGHRWFGYTIGEGSMTPVGLAQGATAATLYVSGRAYRVREDGSGASLVALSASNPGGARSLRARIAPSDSNEPANLDRARHRGAAMFTNVPSSLPSIDAPSFGLEPIAMEVPEELTWARLANTTTILADRNRGLIAQTLDGSVKLYRTNDLSGQEDLQLATDARQHTWLLSRDRDLARFEAGGLRRVALPEGLRPVALSTGPNGAYVATLLPLPPPPHPAPAPRGRAGRAGRETLNVQTLHAAPVRVYRTEDGESWAPFVERTMRLPQELVDVPFMGVSPEREVWLGLKLARADGNGARMRGVAVLSADRDAVVYHHRSATSDPLNGQGALPVEDEVTTIDFEATGIAWLSSLSGAVRVSSDQSVTFGEARGVRGEIVSDVVSGAGGLVWIASAEGLGSYDGTRFDFDLPASVREARPMMLAADADGHLWGAGTRGAIFYDGTTWTRHNVASGFPTDLLRDVEVDADGNAFFLAADRLIVLER